MAMLVYRSVRVLHNFAQLFHLGFPMFFFGVTIASRIPARRLRVLGSTFFGRPVGDIGKSESQDAGAAEKMGG